VKSRMLVAIVALIAVSAFFTGRSFSDDKKPGEMQMSDEQMAQMAEYMKYATPDAHHKALEHFVGGWNFVSKFWMEPGAPAQESKGTCESSWLLDGRYVQDVVSGDMMGMPFNGFGLNGYDLVKNEYFSIWMDNMSTAPMVSKGQMDASGKVLTVVGTYPDVMQNKKEITYKTVTKIIGPDEHVMEMYVVGDGGKEFKNMEMTYTRKK